MCRWHLPCSHTQIPSVSFRFGVLNAPFVRCSCVRVERWFNVRHRRRPSLGASPTHTHIENPGVGYITLRPIPFLIPLCAAARVSIYSNLNFTAKHFTHRWRPFLGNEDHARGDHPHVYLLLLSVCVCGDPKTGLQCTNDAQCGAFVWALVFRPNHGRRGS